MPKQPSSTLGFLFVAGIAAALWYGGGVWSTSVPVPDDAPEVGHQIAQAIDWGDLNYYFTVSNPRVEQRFDPMIDPTGYWVVAFEVTAKETTRGSIFVAEFQDAAGVRAGVGNLPLMFDPDFVTQPPFRWEQGQRSHAWFLIPDDYYTDRNGRPAPKPVRVVIRQFAPEI